jgi:hypothetical protein
MHVLLCLVVNAAIARFALGLHTYRHTQKYFYACHRGHLVAKDTNSSKKNLNYGYCGVTFFSGKLLQTFQTVSYTVGILVIYYKKH